MNTIVSSSRPATLGTHDGLLRFAVRLDACVSTVFGVALLAGGGLISDAVGAPSTFLLVVGAVCLLYGAVLWSLQARTRLSRRAGSTVVAANTAWVVVSVLLVVFGWLPLTQLGVGLVVLQAVEVAALADLQLLGVLRTRS